MTVLDSIQNYILQPDAGLIMVPFKEDFVFDLQIFGFECRVTLPIVLATKMDLLLSHTPEEATRILNAHYAQINLGLPKESRRVLSADVKSEIKNGFFALGELEREEIAGIYKKEENLTTDLFTLDGMVQNVELNPMYAQIIRKIRFRAEKNHDYNLDSVFRPFTLFCKYSITVFPSILSTKKLFFEDKDGKPRKFIQNINEYNPHEFGIDISTIDSYIENAKIIIESNIYANKIYTNKR